jgi:NTP pyrophosphatase (non-canonical NTP hydrolase)
MAHSRQEKMEAFGRLLDIMDDLRAGCPWDRKQTMETLRPLTIEETYELGDAILDEDLPEVKKEIGDILLHMVFYAKIGEEKEAFDMADVLDSIAEKLIHRHPHIYGDTVAEDEETVKANWESLKLKEGKKSVLEGVPKSLQAMLTPDAVEVDIKSAQFCLMAAIVDRVSVVLTHPAAEFPQLRRYCTERDVIMPTVHPNPGVSKAIALGVLNGMRIPDGLSDNEFAVGLLRWLSVSLDPTFHT